jgi:uncharacterized protein involved in exopolysaccharide biosynthesis
MEESSLSNQHANGVHSPTLRDFLTIAFRHQRLMVISFVGIVLGATFAAVLQPYRYQAGMKILVKRERADPVVTPDASTAPQFSLGVTEEEVNSEVELLKSRDLLENVVRTCGLQDSINSPSRTVLAAMRNGRGSPEPDKPIASAVRRLQKQLNVEVVKKTNLIAVNYESSDPKLAASVLSTLANLYLEKHLAVHRPPGAFDFFQHETEAYRKELADAESRLVDFGHKAKTVSPQREKEAALQKLAEFDATLKQTRAAIVETQQRIRVLQEQAASIPSRMVTQIRKSDDAALLSQLRSNLLALELKRTELLAKFAPGYRPVQEVDTQIAQTRDALSTAEKSQLHEETTDRDPAHEVIREELAKATADLAGLQTRAVATAAIVQSYEQDYRSLEPKEIVHDDLIRTVKATEENYLLYLRKAEEARISDALDRRRIINVAIAEAATVPSLPSNKRSVTVLVGLLLATVLSVGLAFGCEYLDSTLRTPEEVKLFLSVPLLATVPKNSKNGTAAHVP